ncbi:hypothetical protein ACIQU5_10390 [Streptomyces sp. NPDC090306]|uniref:hypothetical protein n=1 Tax=Streptomyces sp. NPDC090306 TaxID=3365961 RepID=UPI003819BCBE
MTQSGQGDEPSARPAREGIVLPSDGGEPLLPGRTGASASEREAGRHAPAVNPPGGKAWGDGGWDQDARGIPADGQVWPEAPAQAWHDPEPSQPSHAGGWNGAAHSSGGAHPSGGAGPLPPENAPAPGGSYDGYQQQYDAYGNQGAHGGYGGYDPQQSPPAHGGADEGATQYLPPVPAGPDEAATQYIPPVGSGALPPELSHESTQYLGRAPQGQAGQQYGGAPGQAADPDAEATRFMAPVEAHDPHAYGGQQGNAPQGGHGLGPQGGPEDRTPPAEFDNLFRTDSGAEPQGSTQQFPRYQQNPAAGAPYAGGPGGPGGPQDGNGGDQWGTPGPGQAPRRRSGSRVPLIAAIGIGIVVLGVGAGALLSGGGGDDKAAGPTASATAPASDGSASASTDQAKAQAVALDKLLSESGDSRASVIKAVSNVKACSSLGDAASDLRDASQQRKDLVTKLAQLSVDRLPQHAALTTALNNAWQASASADSHYAAWADQTAGKNGCKKGQARNTGQSQAGAVASGTASSQKARAAELWNAIAKTYGLTERQPTQL